MSYRVFRIRCKKYNVLRDKSQISRQLWASDVNYVRINQAFYAICVVIDVFSRKVLSHSISDKNDTALVLTAFRTAFTARNNPQGVTFHSYNLLCKQAQYDAQYHSMLYSAHDFAVY